jgi:hypothetical protein
MMKSTILPLLFAAFSTLAQEKVLKAPELKEGDGPYPQLIIPELCILTELERHRSVPPI